MNNEHIDFNTVDTSVTESGGQLENILPSTKKPREKDEQLSERALRAAHLIRKKLFLGQPTNNIEICVGSTNEQPVARERNERKKFLLSYPSHLRSVWQLGVHQLVIKFLFFLHERSTDKNVKYSYDWRKDASRIGLVIEDEHGRPIPERFSIRPGSPLDKLLPKLEKILDNGESSDRPKRTIPTFKAFWHTCCCGARNRITNQLAADYVAIWDSCPGCSKLAATMDLQAFATDNDSEVLIEI